MKIRVVIPCFNEGEVITQTHQQLTEILSQDSSVKGYDYNMLFIDDGVGDFRLLSQRAVKSIASLEEYNRFSKGLFEWIGYNTKVFTYQNVERQKGESKWSFKKLFNYGIDGLISFNSKPLRMMIYLGLFIFSISVLYIIYLFINIMISGVNIPGYFSTIAAILLLGGIQLISIGVVGEYIGRIYYEVKARPKYIIQATNLSSIENAEKDTHKVYSK
ncbi:hypothetical protein [Staphylococcus aureus]|uniref:hypothetical protein n=1 Tax=Staphylococcus aureus TaxID=1280 RepID=UPI00374D43AE